MRLRMEIDSMPQELDEIERRIMQLEIEREALKKEKDKASVEQRRTEPEKEIADAQEKNAGLTAHWEAEKQASSGRTSKSDRSSSCAAELEEATREGDLERRPSCATARSGPGAATRRRAEGAWMPEVRRGSSARKSGRRTLPRSSAKWTGIPVAKMLEGDRERCDNGVVAGPAGRGPGGGGQGGRGRGAAQPGGAGRLQPAHRLVHVPGAHGRGQDGLSQGAWPNSSSTPRTPMVRIDMSEFMEPHAVSRLSARRRVHRL